MKTNKLKFNPDKMVLLMSPNSELDNVLLKVQLCSLGVLQVPMLFLDAKVTVLTTRNSCAWCISYILFWTIERTHDLVTSRLNC